MNRDFTLCIVLMVMTSVCLSCNRNSTRETVFVREDLQYQLDSFISIDENKEFYYVYLAGRPSDTLVVLSSSYYYLPPTSYLPIVDRETEIYLIGSVKYRNKLINISYISDIGKENYEHLFYPEFDKYACLEEMKRLRESCCGDEEPILRDNINQLCFSFNETGVEIVDKEENILPYPLAARSSDYFYCSNCGDKYILRLDYESNTFQLLFNGNESFGLMNRKDNDILLSGLGNIHNSVLLQRPTITTHQDSTRYIINEFRVKVNAENAVLEFNDGLELLMKKIE